MRQICRKQATVAQHAVRHMTSAFAWRDQGKLKNDVRMDSVPAQIENGHFQNTRKMCHCFASIHIFFNHVFNS